MKPCVKCGKEYLLGRSKYCIDCKVKSFQENNKIQKKRQYLAKKMEKLINIPDLLKKERERIMGIAKVYGSPDGYIKIDTLKKLTDPEEEIKSEIRVKKVLNSLVGKIKHARNTGAGTSIQIKSSRISGNSRKG